MHLGDLEYKPEGFDKVICDFSVTAGHPFAEHELIHLVELLTAYSNSTLEEKLKDASPIYGRKNGKTVTWAHPRPWKSFGDLVGRIVAIGPAETNTPQK